MPTDNRIHTCLNLFLSDLLRWVSHATVDHAEPITPKKGSAPSPRFVYVHFWMAWVSREGKAAKHFHKRPCWELGLGRTYGTREKSPCKSATAWTLGALGAILLRYCRFDVWPLIPAAAGLSWLLRARSRKHVVVQGELRWVCRCP